MKRLLQLFTAGVLLLFVGLSISNAQVYSAGPSTAATSGAANGGFAWGDMNGDGLLDLFIPSNNLLINGVGSFPQNAAATANVTLNTNSVGLALADFNGDGVPDLMTTNGGTPSAGLYYYTGGVFTAATGTGDLAGVPTYGQLFQGLGVGPIDHTNYLSVVIPHNAPIAYSDGLVLPRGLGMKLLKGGASGFTNIANGATALNLAIDTSKSFEMWDPRFVDVNNDGWMDLMVPSFRHGLRSTWGGPDSAGARKGSILFLNDGTGKFVIPTSTSVGRTLYTFDSVSVGGFTKGHAAEDTGIVVNDTVRHFSAIGNQVGDLNNDGNIDMMFTGTEANWNGLGASTNTVIIYGKGDGTFTYAWNGVTTVPHGVNSAGNQRAMSIGDYNNDGWPDIYISQTFGAQLLFKNNGNGTFTNVTTEAVVTGGGQRAGGFVDYNNDGFLDIYQYTGGNSVLQRNNGNANRWIGFKPVGIGNNKMAIGARFTVWTGANKQIRDIRASGGAAGDGYVNAHFGLASGNADSVMVQWPDGTTNKWTRTQLSANGGTTVENKYWTIQQGAIIPAAVVKATPIKGVNDTLQENSITIKWNKASGGTGTYSYQYQVATAISFATLFRTATGLTDTTATIKLALSTKYYWRVRAFSAGFTGPWSAVDSFWTKIVPATTAPTKILPANNSLTEPVRPTLKFSYIPEASPNHVQVSDTIGFAPANRVVLNDSVNIFDTTYSFASNLVPGRKYYWRVRSWNAAGSSPYSPVDSFTIMYLPVAPALSNPVTNQADVIANNVTFKWRKVAGDSNYVLQYWTYTSAGMVLVSDTTKHDTSFTVSSSLAYRQRYFWQVKAFNQGGTGPYSTLDSFTTAIEPPPAVVTISPKGVSNVSRNPLFTWRPTLNATKYHLQVASANNFTVPANIVIDEVQEDTVRQIAAEDTLLANTTYYWRVAASNIGGEGTFSASGFFTTGTTFTTGVDDANSNIPKEYALNQNYPNPFNPSTTIGYDLPKDAFVKVIIYDVLGRQVATLVDAEQAASRYRLSWNASGVSTGVYFYRIHARSLDGSGEFSAVKKLLFMK